LLSDAFGSKKTLLDEAGNVNRVTKTNEKAPTKKKKEHKDNDDSERSKKKIKRVLANDKNVSHSSGLFDDDPFASVSGW
jgi:hypothetical protein